MKKEKKTSIIILAAGKGIRMKSNLPKVVHKFKGIPMIKIIVSNLSACLFDKIVIVVGYKKNFVMDCLSDFRSIDFAVQDKQNGTADAVMTTKDYFKNYKGNIVIIPGDVPLIKCSTIKELCRIHKQKKAQATVLTTTVDDPAGYGRVVRNKNGFVEKIVEHKDASLQEKEINEINSGIFCFDAKTLFHNLPLINNNNSQNEFYLTDILEILKQEDNKIAAMKINDNIEVSGINSIEQLLNLEALIS